MGFVINEMIYFIIRQMRMITPGIKPVPHRGIVNVYLRMMVLECAIDPVQSHDFPRSALLPWLADKGLGVMK